MLKNKTLALAFIATAMLAIPANAASGNAAQPVSAKLGYFNLQMVKASYPEAAAVNSLEEKAKEMLRHNVEEGNKQLQEMQKAGKPKEEIEKKQHELQTAIAAQQQALGQLLSSNSIEANRAIAQAAVAVAKDKGLDVVIDGAGIFAGGEKFINNGEDVTDAVIKRLVPQQK
jgi:Skp family chaperone for outer membrane proteins